MFCPDHAEPPSVPLMDGESRGPSKSCGGNGSSGPNSEGLLYNAGYRVYPVEARGEWQFKQDNKLVKLCFLGKLFWQQFGVVAVSLKS